MHLRYLDVQGLIARADGDPWAVDQTLQRGSPAQISDLAKAFHEAGQSTKEADAAFEEARRRFEEAWNRKNGEHPINDADEVRRVTKSLKLQASQLPKIAVDLEQLAAVLAQAQRASAARIAALEQQLERIDPKFGETLNHALTGRWPPWDLRLPTDAINDLIGQAVCGINNALREINFIRDRYSDVLRHLTHKMRSEDGYDAAPVAAWDGHDIETPEQAERDVHAALAGDLQAATRINDILDSITEEQRAGKAPLTPEQASVLSQLQAQQNGMTIEAFHAAFCHLGDQGKLIANSWQLMSTPGLKFPRTELKPGAVQGTEIVEGNTDLLPTALLPSDVLLRGRWNPFVLERITKIASAGDPKLRANTGFDAIMLQHAASVMRDGLDKYEDVVVTKILALVAPDHQIVHNMVVSPEGNVFLDNLTSHPWLDRGKSAASLFEWVQGAAQGPEARLAGETARAYGVYIGTHSTDLLHLAGGHTVGEINPDLVQSMAHGLAPYVNNIAGIPGSLVEFGNSVDAIGDIENGRMPIAKGIFSVLSTDQTASNYFNGAAEQHALLAEAAYARDLVSHAPNMNSYNTQLGSAMALRGLVDTGIHNAVQAQVVNHQIAEDAAQRTEYNFRKTAYEAGLKVASTAVGLTPAGTIGGAAVNILGGIVEGDVLGEAPQPSSSYNPSVPLMSIGRADREILNALIASGQHVPVPDAYLVNGHIGTPDELAGVIGGLSADEYDHVLNQALVNLFNQSFGHDPAAPAPVVPDQHMMNRYNAVVAEPTPLAPR